MNSENGVTLIALILFVVILLILSAIAIRLAVKSVDAEIESSSVYYELNNVEDVQNDENIENVEESDETSEEENVVSETNTDLVEGIDTIEVTSNN